MPEKPERQAPGWGGSFGVDGVFQPWRRGDWQVRLRWWVPVAILVAVGIGRWLGFEFDPGPLVAVAAFVLAYNAVFAVLFARRRAREPRETGSDRRDLLVQVLLDYTAMFLLVRFTGGVDSPLILFYVFHVIFAAILFRPSFAFSFAALASLSLVVLALGELNSWLGPHPVGLGGTVLFRTQGAADAVVTLAFFVATVFIAAAVTTAIVHRARAGVRDITEANARIAVLNRRLSGLYDMIRRLGPEPGVDAVLHSTVADITELTGFEGTAVKLLSDDGLTLRYASGYGLPPTLLEERVVEVARSPLNRRVLEGAAVVQGRLGGDDAFQTYDDLLAAGVRSVLFAPMTAGRHVVGILGAYSHRSTPFSSDDEAFFKLAAETIAILVEIARKRSAVEQLSQARQQFMLQVAHNMRAPLTAGLSMLFALRDGYVGPLTAAQLEQLGRASRRLDALNTALGKLLTVARRGDPSTVLKSAPVDAKSLVASVGEGFREAAARKHIGLELRLADGLPRLAGDAEILGEMLENLVSNAIKYTPDGGQVTVELTSAATGGVELVVRDTGIGIPARDQQRVFEEFFRAANAAKLDEVGTGLGLSLVKQAVELHGGRIGISSTLGSGTEVRVWLPAA